jgi:hypothetical protein
MVFMPMTLTAVYGVAEERVGVASAMLNTAQQIGAALGVSVLATGAGLLLIAAVIVIAAVTTGTTQNAVTAGSVA